ncbi:MAG: hypothetical protein U0903_10775 [Planctomycetales bacterium]
MNDSRLPAVPEVSPGNNTSLPRAGARGLWRFLPRFSGLPLLAKEMQEQAQHRATYVNRVLFCAILYTTVLSLKLPELLSIKTPYGLLGKGKDIFDAVAWMQTIMVLVFMPMLCCGVISHEKEQNTLQLLLLTRLSPWTIILQKFLSRIIAMGTYLLATLPLLVLAYPLGGVTSDAVQEFIFSQILTIIWIGAISVCCSAWCTTPHSSLLMTYLVTGGITGLFYISILMWAMMATRGMGSPPHWLIYADPLTFPLLVFSIPQAAFLRAPPSMFAVISVPTLIQTFAALSLARLFLVRRATVTPQNPLLKLFRWADGWFQYLNENPVTRGVHLIKPRATLPRDKPVAWREQTRSVVGSPTHLTRLFILFMTPLGIFVYFSLIVNVYWSPVAWTAMLSIVWIPAMLMVLVGSAVLIPAEMSRQTLDVLLSTSLSSREILLEKRGGILRLMGMFFLIFLIMSAVRLYTARSTETTELANWIFGVWSLCCFWIYLSIVSWLAIAASLLHRKLLRSLILSTLILLTWLGWGLSLNSPLIQDLLVQKTNVFQTSALPQYRQGRPVRGNRSPAVQGYYMTSVPVPLDQNLKIQSLFLISPLAAIWPEAVSENWDHGILEFPYPWIANLAIHGLALWMLRSYCLRTFARKVGRLDPQPAFKETA